MPTADHRGLIHPKDSMACLQDQSTPETDAERSTSPMTSKNKHHESDKPDASAEDILALQDLDPGMDKKMHLVNNVSAPPNNPTA